MDLAPLHKRPIGFQIAASYNALSLKHCPDKAMSFAGSAKCEIQLIIC